jgi:hypothetical protein
MTTAAKTTLKVVEKGEVNIHIVPLKVRILTWPFWHPNCHHPFIRLFIITHAAATYSIQQTKTRPMTTPPNSSTFEKITGILEHLNSCNTLATPKHKCEMNVRRGWRILIRHFSSRCALTWELERCWQSAQRRRLDWDSRTLAGSTPTSVCMRRGRDPPSPPSLQNCNHFSAAIALNLRNCNLNPSQSISLSHSPDAKKQSSRTAKGSLRLETLALNELR